MSDITSYKINYQNSNNMLGGSYVKAILKTYLLQVGDEGGMFLSWFNERYAKDQDSRKKLPEYKTFLKKKLEEINQKILNDLVNYTTDFDNWKNIVQLTLEDYLHLCSNNGCSDGDTIYANDMFHLFNRDVIERVIKCMNIHYDHMMNLAPTNGANNLDSKWVNGIKPHLNNFEDINYYFAQKVLLKNFDKNAQIHIIGDIHSSFHSLFKVLTDIKASSQDLITGEITSDTFVGNTLKLKPNRYIIFTGDIVDRGPYGLESLILVSLLKLYNPFNVFICDGNHEDYDTYSRHGFSSEMSKQIKNKEDKTDEDLIDEIIKLSCKFPSVLFVRFDTTDKTYQFNHGAFATVLGEKSLLVPNNPLANFLKDFNTEEKYMDFSKTYDRQHQGYENFKWGDFFIEGIGKDGYEDYIESHSGRPKLTHKSTKKYLETNNIVAIFSGHQDTIPFSYLPKNITDKPKNPFKFMGRLTNNIYGLERDTLGKGKKIFRIFDIEQDLLALTFSLSNIPKRMTYIGYGTLLIGRIN